MDYPLYEPIQSSGIVVRPLVATVILHAILLSLMSANWVSERTITVKPREYAKAIDARLIDAQTLKPKPKASPKPKAKPKPKPVAKKPVAQAKPKPAAKPKAAAQPKKTEPKVETKPDEPKMSAEELARLAKADLARAMASEEEAQQAATADQMSVSFQALIQRTVTQYWSRPPSARNGMEVLLALQLVPTGDVVGVTVLKSSGDTAFDRSAINAVRKAERFPELAQLPSRVFERDFRRLQLLFRPEDLRY